MKVFKQGSDTCYVLTIVEERMMEARFKEVKQAAQGFTAITSLHSIPMLISVVSDFTYCNIMLYWNVTSDKVGFPLSP